MPSTLHRDLQRYILHKLSYFSPKREVHFGAINRTADVVVESKKLVFEIQCSRISRAEILRRNGDYQQRGYRTIWILHARKYGKRIPSHAELYLKEREHYFSNYCQTGGDIYDRYFFSKKSHFKYMNPIKIETISPFIHTKATTTFKKHAQYYCKGDLIDSLLSDPDAAETLIKRLFPPKISVKKYFLDWFDTQLKKNCSH